MVEENTEDSLRIDDKVDYTYVNFSHVAANNWDVRISFGDKRTPEGKVQPLLGIIMSHQHAKAFLDVLKISIARLEERSGREIVYEWPEAPKPPYVGDSLRGPLEGKQRRVKAARRKG